MDEALSRQTGIVVGSSLHVPGKPPTDTDSLMSFHMALGNNPCLVGIGQRRV